MDTNTCVECGEDGVIYTPEQYAAASDTERATLTALFWYAEDSDSARYCYCIDCHPNLNNN